MELAVTGKGDIVKVLEVSDHPSGKPPYSMCKPGLPSVGPIVVGLRGVVVIDHDQVEVNGFLRNI